jgi:hypothetical protein
MYCYRTCALSESVTFINTSLQQDVPLRKTGSA